VQSENSVWFRFHWKVYAGGLAVRSYFLACNLSTVVLDLSHTLEIANLYPEKERKLGDLEKSLEK